MKDENIEHKSHYICIDTCAVQKLALTKHSRELTEVELQNMQEGIWEDIDAQMHLVDALNCAILYAIEGETPSW